jgi:hypothetical protein
MHETRIVSNILLGDCEMNFQKSRFMVNRVKTTSYAQAEMNGSIFFLNFQDRDENMRLSVLRIREIY